MGFARLRRLLRSRWSAWLIAWALCLPMAQWAAAAHGLLHLKAAAASEERESPAKLPVACEVCVLAAAIGSAAPGPVTAAFIIAAAPHALPAAPPVAAPALPLTTGYRSRAPPFLHA